MAHVRRRLAAGAAFAALACTFALLPTPPAGAASAENTAFVARTLRVLEGDDPPATVEALADRIDAGTSRRTIVAERVAGDVYQAVVVEELYRQILNRDANDAEVAFWSGQLETRGEYLVRAQLLGSGEFLNANGGTKGGFVDGVYRVFLGRVPNDSGRNFWIGQTGDSVSSRAFTALRILRSSEGRNREVTALFGQILSRTPDDAGRAFFAGRLNTAFGIENVTIELAVSTEAFTQSQRADQVFLLFSGNRVVRADAETLDPVDDPVTFPTTGMAAQLGITALTELVAIDVRPHTQVLYGLGSDGQLYSLNADSATASKLGSPNPLLAGDVVGFDFNPVVDRIRIVTATGENYRVNPDTGGQVDGDPMVAGVQPDGNLAYAVGDDNEGVAPMVSGSGYTNSSRGRLGTALPSTTVLYGLDTAADALIRQDPPNSGTLNTVGGLGVDLTGPTGFDISPDTGRSLAVSVDGDTLTSYRIELSTGRAFRQNSADGGTGFLGLAVVPAPVESGQGWLLSLGDATEIVSFNLATPGTAAERYSITGVTGGTSLVALDVRNATGMAYVLGTDGQLYVLGAPKAGTPTTLPAEKIGTPVADLAREEGAVGFDFNPAVDRLRFVSGVTNRRVNPNNATLVDADPILPGVQNDGDLAYAAGDPNFGDPPNVDAAAYTNPVIGGVAAMTELYDIDSNNDSLATQDPPNAGTLNTDGELGISSGNGLNGFDVQSGSATALLVRTDNKTLYTVDLDTGAASGATALPSGLGDVTGFTLT